MSDNDNSIPAHASYPPPPPQFQGGNTPLLKPKLMKVTSVDASSNDISQTDNCTKFNDMSKKSSSCQANADISRAIIAQLSSESGSEMNMSQKSRQTELDTSDEALNAHKDSQEMRPLKRSDILQQQSLLCVAKVKNRMNADAETVDKDSPSQDILTPESDGKYKNSDIAHVDNNDADSDGSGSCRTSSSCRTTGSVLSDTQSEGDRYEIYYMYVVLILSLCTYKIHWIFF